MEAATEQNNKGGIVEIERPIQNSEPQETKNVSALLKAGVCPVCGERLVYGSQDAETLYYWCRMCDSGPYRFPLGEGPQHPIAPVIDSDTMNMALLSARDPREALRRINLVSHAIRQMIRNNDDRAEITSALNRIITLSGGGTV